MLKVNAVTYSYATQKEQDVRPAIQDVSLRIHAGETVAIIGQNGSGKSTLAKLLAAILKPQHGSILVDDLRTDSGGEALWTIRQRVGIVFQNPDDQLVANTVIDDIAFGPENLGLPRFEIEERVQEAMALLELEPYAQMGISELSVGQKQRVAVAGILAMRPNYLLLDEPTTMISGHTARQLLETVRRLTDERGIALIHITHFMQEISAFQRVIVMDQGRVLMDDSPASIFARTDELHAVGLDVPQIVSLGRRLRARGWTGLPETVLSVEQLKASAEAPARTSTLGGDERHLPLPASTPAPTDYEISVREARENSIPIFELRDVHYTHLRGTPFAIEALSGLSLTIPESRTVALVGPTQAGKSTVVDILAGLVKPASGTFLFQGIDAGDPSFDIERLRTGVGVVFQSPETQIFEETVGKDVSFGLQVRKIPFAESRRLVQESLEAVGLVYEDFRTRYTYALSGGQKRRVAIAGVLALQPKVIIFDEPTAGLDPRGRYELLELIQQLKNRHNLTIIYTSSSLQDVIGLADLIYILDRGHTLFSGTPREILARAGELEALDISLPEAAQIALALRQVIPGIHTDVLNLAELEHEIEKVSEVTQ